MIPFDEAWEITMKSVHRLGAERVPIDRALNRVLAENVRSDSDLPPFNKSAMDGYACRRADLGGMLRLLETIPAGKCPTRSVGPNECSKIMTGAMVPDGADCVIMVEFTEESGGLVSFTGTDTETNICRRAEDLKAGEIILPKGTRLRPRHIGVLATAGCVKPLVSVRPRVGIVATGDELVEPDTVPGSSQIRNSNSYQLRSQVDRMGAQPQYYGIAIDTADTLDTMIRDAASESDVLLVSGGVSTGDFDLVPDMLKKNGFELLFEKIATKPGKPTVFGVADRQNTRKDACATAGMNRRTFCFGLPGNPVSTFVLFELLVKPFLLAMMGHEFAPPVVPLRLARDVTRKKTARDSWIPVTITGAGEADPIEYHGSGHLTSLPLADGMICIPRGVKGAAKGDSVNVRQF